jgi:hypothetical protein
MHKGACLCRAVTFEIHQETLLPADACHCQQCRKQSGHYFVSTDVPRSSLVIHGAENLSWYASSALVRRGFCSSCGSTLFWDAIKKDRIAVAMGAFDTATMTHIAVHIFVAEKGDYYDITDGLPQNLH